MAIAELRASQLGGGEVKWFQDSGTPNIGDGRGRFCTLRAEPVPGGNTSFAGGAQKPPEAAELATVAAFRKCEAGVRRVIAVAFAH